MAIIYSCKIILLYYSLIPTNSVLAKVFPPSNRDSASVLVQTYSTPEVNQGSSFTQTPPLLSLGNVYKDEEDAQLPLERFQVETKRKTREAHPAFLDDEDYVDDEGSGSGSAELDTKPGIKGPTSYKIVVLIHSPWTPALNDSSSELHKGITNTMEDWISSIFDKARIGPIKLSANNRFPYGYTDCTFYLELPKTPTHEQILGLTRSKIQNNQLNFTFLYHFEVNQPMDTSTLISVDFNPLTTTTTTTTTTTPTPTTAATPPHSHPSHNSPVRLGSIPVESHSTIDPVTMATPPSQGDPISTLLPPSYLVLYIFLAIASLTFVLITFCIVKRKRNQS